MGCGSEGGAASYTKEVKMTEEQKAKVDEVAKSRAAGGANAAPGTLKGPTGMN